MKGGHTFEVVKEVVVDVSRGLGPTVAIIDTDEGPVGSGVEEGQRAGLDLALVLEKVVGLNDGHGELTGQVVAAVFVPKKAFLATGRVRNRRRAPAGPHKVHQL